MGQPMAYWVQFMDEDRWMPGTVLTIPSDVPPFVHFVMVEFTDFHTWEQACIHNMPGSGVTFARLADVISGKPIRVFWRPRTQEEALAAIQRMQSLVGHPYHLIEANCEHVIRWAVTGEWRSQQVSAVKAGLLVASTAAIVASL
jgi:hypothetical protein